MSGLQKFGRTFRLTIWPLDNGPPIIATLPLTIKFNTQRGLTGSLNNTLDIDIYNLSSESRRRIYQDKNVVGQYFTNETNPDGQPTASFNILLEAGYSQLYRIFYGRILTATLLREKTNIVTRIHATNGLIDLLGTNVNTTLPAGTDLTSVLLFLCGQFPNLQIGAIADYPAIFTRGVSLQGNAWQLLKRYSAGNAYIDNGKIYVIGHQNVTSNLFTVNDASGILQTPQRQDYLLTVNTLLEAGIQELGQQIQIASTILPQFNGNYKLLQITHRGMISGAICGEAVTSLLLNAPGLYNGFTQVAPGAPAA